MPTIHPWPDYLDDVWAKSPSVPGQPGESLALHTWRVLERLRDLQLIRPRLADQLGEPRLWHRLFWACVLHDLGKVAPGFQDRLHGRGETTDAKDWGCHRHEVISLAFVPWLFPIPETSELADTVPGADRRWVVAAVVSHHRDVSEITSLYPPGADSGTAEILARVPSDIILSIYSWLRDCIPVWAATLGMPGVERISLPPCDDAINLVTSGGSRLIASLLREYREWVRRLDGQRAPSTAELLLRGLLLQADHTASAHTRGLAPFQSTPSELRSTWRLTDEFPHQRACGEVDGSVILTAPTGSGKTEAALLWATRQAEREGSIPRLFYTLPYQASMNAMYRRLCSIFSARQVGLQHGRSLLALYRLAMEAEPSPALAERRARWQRKLAYLNYFAVRVFSPYQMLKAMYRLKGYEAMLLDYFGAAFVFDEIHAYAPEKLGLVLALVEHLQAEFGARFLVMSATLPTIARRRLAEAIGRHTAVEASRELYQAFRRHQIAVLDGDLLDRLDLIVEKVNRGMSVLVACNTVRRAQDAWRRLRSLLPETEIVLLHGRFNGQDRLAREEIVRDATGVRSEARRPIVLVATQVVEVSLDIDLDTIFSDPAPLEALIQRFGRINRQRRQSGLAVVHVFREPAGGSGVYAASLVRSGLAILERANGDPVDESEIAVWLDEIYQGAIAERWEEAYRRSLHDGRQILRGLRPFESDENLADVFDAAFDAVEVLPAGLYERYRQVAESDPIRASSLLVPITEASRRQLQRKGLIRSTRWPPVVDVPYSSEIGLDLSGFDGRDG